MRDYIGDPNYPVQCRRGQIGLTVQARIVIIELIAHLEILERLRPFRVRNFELHRARISQLRTLLALDLGRAAFRKPCTFDPHASLEAQFSVRAE